MFDVSLADSALRTISFETPPLGKPSESGESWRIGCIVGPSGSGKSTIARHLFGDSYYHASDWPQDKAVIDGFGNLPIKTITKMLTTVGLSSPPSWLKPYYVLSQGEKFRCDLAKALLQGGRVVFDEYTSVIDRNVAKTASAALAKTLSGTTDDPQCPNTTTQHTTTQHTTTTNTTPCHTTQFVAVSCHYDILDWLEPDWVLDTATGRVIYNTAEDVSIEAVSGKGCIQKKNTGGLLWNSKYSVADALLGNSLSRIII